MSFNFHNLDHEEIRQIIHDEINYDIENKVVYYSKRFNENGQKNYLELLFNHTRTGSEQTLAEDLKSMNCFKEKEDRITKGRTISASVPANAHLVFAEGEFNRFYIRAVCIKALKENKNVIVYRARSSENPREESELLIGKSVDPSKLLKDLRTNIGIDTALGLPHGPNSGLSVKLG